MNIKNSRFVEVLASVVIGFGIAVNMQAQSLTVLHTFNGEPERN
jgi:hypothetical protein